MTNFTILIDDADREKNAHLGAPWTATLYLGAPATHDPQPEAAAVGNSPGNAAENLVMLAAKDLLYAEPEDCPDCGVVKNTEAWRTWHDPDGNCHAHRMPR